MPEFRIEATGEALEVYEFKAESEEEAREMFLRGDVPQPVVTECSTDIDSIEQIPGMP